MHKLILVALCVLAGVGSAPGDILPSNFKPVRHVVRFENLREFTNHVFYVQATNSYSRDQRMKPIQVTDEGIAMNNISPIYVTDGAFRLFAVPKARLRPSPHAFDEAWVTNSFPDILQCKLPVTPFRALPARDRTDLIEEIYRIKASPGQLEVIPVRIGPRADAAGAAQALLLTAAPAIFILFRRTRSLDRGRP